MQIRPYQADDANTVRYICRATAQSKRYTKYINLVTALYCDYYIEREPDNCFVLTDEFDKPVGYILCSSDDEKYQRDFAPYLKKARKDSFIEAVGHRIEQKLTANERAKYPAHLHIDILPSFQGRGGGRSLINALIAKLRSQGVSGLRLTVSQSNKGAVAFYERLGFVRIKRIGSLAYVYAMDL